VAEPQKVAVRFRIIRIQISLLRRLGSELRPLTFI
jgi:hypothetical protein